MGWLLLQRLLLRLLPQRLLLERRLLLRLLRAVAAADDSRRCDAMPELVVSIQFV